MKTLHCYGKRPKSRGAKGAGHPSALYRREDGHVAEVRPPGHVCGVAADQALPRKEGPLVEVEGPGAGRGWAAVGGGGA